MCDTVLGIYNPYKFKIKTFEGYDILKFRNHIRFLEVLEDRNYGANGFICPLFFNGASSWWEELPSPSNNPLLESYYERVELLDNTSKSNTHKLFFLKRLINKY